MNERTIASAFRSGIAWNTLNAVFSQGAGFVIFIILAQVLEPAIFGAVALSAILADFVAIDGRYAGMDAILQRGKFEKEDLNGAFASLSLVAGPVALLLVFAGPLVGSFEQAPLVSYYMPVFGTLLIFTPWLSVMDALIMRELGFKTFAKRNMLSTVAGGLAGIAFAFTDLALWALPAQRIVSTLVVVIFEFIHTRWVPGVTTDSASKRDILRRFIPLWLVAAINISMQRAAMLVFGIRFDSTTVGLFRAADRISESLQNPVISPLFALWFPLMSKVRGDVAAEARVYTAIIRTSAFVALPAFAGLAIVAPDLIQALLPATYDGAAPILKAVAITALMIPVVWFNPIAMNALSMNRLSLQYSTCVAATCIGALVAIPTSSPAAAVYVMSAPALAYGIYGNIILLRRLQLSIFGHYLGLLPAILAAGVMAAITVFVREALLSDLPALGRLAICAACGASVYAATLLLFSRRWTNERIQLLVGRG
ncbi:oligosaccharide flippase family protein [Rhizobium sp. BE258]|uniref:oligosaccharide flippase family protein n=1 Tax=Rhizobium sp. BE258 TaxID=2817722 RepID=UPI002862B4CB|nr:oligosaccharide flippase family protein [Rhizobium sp. BE258]MDR7145324.1 O-antigen/teichoic acid export membrane protein [Rhizobium sp. BE258]